MSRDVRVGRHVLGHGRCFVIAEAGVNHNGSPELAHRLVDVAADAGADAVKFQTFDPEQLVAADAKKARYQAAATGSSESQLDMLRALVLPTAVFKELRAHAIERGIEFLSTAFDLDSARMLVDLGMGAIKVPSGEITNHPFVEELAGFSLPLLVSTGMATLDEVDAVVRVIREAGDPPIALFHCVTNYPTPAEDCNLAAMATLRRAFGCPVGWSDHTAGYHVSLAAVALGAELIEKHFTLDRAMPGPDHGASLEPDELARMMRELREVERSLGNGVKAPAASEIENVHVARRSLHAARDLRAGEVLQAGDVVALRPGDGISPAAVRELVGRRLGRGVASGAQLRLDDLA